MTQSTQKKASVSVYLNFSGNTEEVFSFYKSVFKTEYVGDISRFGDMPPRPDAPSLPDHVKKMVMHVALPLIGDFVLMGSDAPQEMGHTVIKGNNAHISLLPASRAEADRLFNELSAGGEVKMPMEDAFWGLFGMFTDKFGVCWMINFDN